MLTGTSEVGVTIVSDNDFVLTLDNVSITSADGSDEQALKTKNTSTCFLVLVGERTLTGCTDSSGETTTNAVKASGSLVISGDEEETEYGAGKGYILINAGQLTINSAGKGLTAGFNPTKDEDTNSSENDPSADVFINNGLITITTYTTPREDTYTNGVSNDDGVSPEGVEGKHSVTINGGKIIINTTDDCINTSTSDSTLVINGGLIYAYSSENDSVNSNGTIVVNGGVLLALGADAPEGRIDCNQDNRFIYTGGTIIAMDGSNQIPQGTGTTGYVLTTGSTIGMGGMPSGMGGMQGGIGQGGMGQGGMGQGGMGQSSLSQGSVLAVVDDEGNVLIAFTVPEGCVTNNVLIASDSLGNVKLTISNAAQATISSTATSITL